MIAIGLCSGNAPGAAHRELPARPRLRDGAARSRRRPSPRDADRGRAGPCGHARRRLPAPSFVADLVLVQDFSYIDQAQPGHAPIPRDPDHRARRRDRPDHGRRGAAQLERLGVGRAGAAARRRPDPARSARPGELAPFAADLRQRLRDLEDEFKRSLGPEAAWDADRLRQLLAHPAARRRAPRRLEPRALHPRQGRRRRRHRAAAGKRPGHRGGAGHARLLGHLDRPRQRHGRPRRRRRRRPDRGCRRTSTTTRFAASGSRRRRRRATTTASPTKACGRCAMSPTSGRCSGKATGSSTAP